MWRLLAQAASGSGEEFYPPDDYYPDDYYDVPAYHSPWEYLWGLIHGIPYWLYVPFVIWMAVYCARHDSASRIWLWVILLFHPFGSLIYFFARWLPSVQFTMPKALQRFTRGKDVRRLEIAASQIGNAHQFVELGDLLRELGQWDRAGAAYESALKKDPASLPALWGCASAQFRQQEYAPAREKLKQILDKDLSYKFGDVSLLYAKTLHAQGEDDLAKSHLEEHIRRWRHPEALYVLATILAEDGQPQAARGHLQAMIHDIESSPRAIARKFFFWKGRAKRLLRRLPA